MKKYPGYFIFFVLLLSSIAVPEELPSAASGGFNKAIQISPKQSHKSAACSFVKVSVRRNEKINEEKISLPTTQNPLPLLSENFETPLSPDWEIYDWFFGIFGGYHWGIRPDPENGLNHCAWCAAGPDSLPPLQQYPDNCASWMVYGPVDLSHANWAKLNFSAWLDTEPGYDFLLWAVSLDNVSFFGEGLSGNSNGWVSLDFDLTAVDSLGDVTGLSQVWFAFIFYSNGSVSGKGTFVDNVELRVANLNTFEVIGKIPSPAPNAAGLASNGTNLFQADYANGRIYRFDNDGSSLTDFDALAEHPAGLDAKDGNLYVVNSETSCIRRLDTDGVDKGESPALNCRPYGIAWQDEQLWVSSICSDTLFLFNNAYASSGFFPIQDAFEKTFTGITWDGTSLWLCDSMNSFIYQLDTNGNIRNYYKAPGLHPTGIAAAENFLWCANSDSIYQLSNPQPPFLELKIVGMDLSAFPQITSYFSIKDELQRPVTTFPKDSFSVWENGFPHAPTELDIRNITEAVGVFLVLDFSTSMSEQDTSEMKKAAHNFINLMGPNDEGGIIQFAGDVNPVQLLTADKALLHRAINDQSFIFSGGTKFFDAIWMATEQLAPSPLRKAVIALTDGLDNKSEATCSTVVRQAIDAGVSVYTIGLGSQTEANILATIADSTGGIYFRAAEATHLDSIYRSISRVLSSDYMLTYQTRNPAKDGSRRTLLISVQNETNSAADTVFYQAPFPENVFLRFPDSLQANFGDTVSVPIWIDDLMFTSIYGIQVDCSFDPTVLKPIRVTNSQTISEQWNLLSSKIKEGNIRFGMVGTSPLTGKGKLAKILCEVVGLPGATSTLIFNAVDLNEGFPRHLLKMACFSSSQRRLLFPEKSGISKILTSAR